MINEFLENLYDEVFYDEFYRELEPTDRESSLKTA